MRAWAWVRLSLGVAAIVTASLVGGATAANLIPATPAEREALIAKIDQQRVGIVTGSPKGVYMTLGSEMANVVEAAEAAKGNPMRVVVMQGRGSIGNLLDLAFLRYTDFAFVQADVLAYLARNNPTDFAYLNDRLAYVARFHPEIIHVVARGGPFKDPNDIAGKTIAMGEPGSGMQITAPIVLNDLLGLHVNLVTMSETQALSDLLSDHPSVDGFVYVTGKGAPLFTNLSLEQSKMLEDKKIYFVPFPSAPPRDSQYLQESLTHETYPQFLSPDQSVPVWGVPAVLAVYDWDKRSVVARSPNAAERAARADRFITAFFDNRLTLAGRGTKAGAGSGFAANWCSVDLANSVPGWTLTRSAKDWLAANPGAQTAICAPH